MINSGRLSGFYLRVLVNELCLSNSVDVLDAVGNLNDVLRQFDSNQVNFSESQKFEFQIDLKAFNCIFLA